MSGRDARQIPIVCGGKRVNEDQRLDASRSTYHRSSQHRYLRSFFLNGKVEDQTNKILTCTRYRGSTFKYGDRGFIPFTREKTKKYIALKI